MYNIYQSQVRKDLQHKVYQKPMCTVKLFGKSYTGIIKEKRIGPWTLRWYQIMGIQLPSDSKSIAKEIEHIKRTYKDKAICVQLGVINEIVDFENDIDLCKDFVDDVFTIRQDMYHLFCQQYGLHPAFRENMPSAAILYDVQQSDDELLAHMNESCRKRVKKAIGMGMQMRMITPDEYTKFFEQRQQTATYKGFSTISLEQYKRLCAYIDQGHGFLI